MVLHFSYCLQGALQEIVFVQDLRRFPVQEREQPRSKTALKRYGAAKWGVVELLNRHYADCLSFQFDLHHWLAFEEKDEVAYFLNETGSNSLNYSSFKIPRAFQVWLGKKGFVIAIEQKGESFDALAVNEKMLKQNEGAAFDFYRRCRSIIFFDHPRETRTVFFQFLF